MEKETFLRAFLLVQPGNVLPGIQRPTAVLSTIDRQENSLSREKNIIK